MDLFKKKLVLTVISTYSPFKFVENPAFRDMLQLLNPDVKVPSVRTFKRNMETLYLESVQRLIVIFGVRIHHLGIQNINSFASG